MVFNVWPGFRHWTLNTPAWICGRQAEMDFPSVWSEQGMEFLTTFMSETSQSEHSIFDGVLFIQYD